MKDIVTVRPFEVIEADARQPYVGEATKVIEKTLKKTRTADVLASAIQDRVPQLEEQFAMWDELYDIAQAALRLRRSDVLGRTVLRAALPNVTIPTDGVESRHFFDIEFADPTSRFLTELREAHRVNLAMRVLFRQERRSTILWSDQALPEANLGEDLQTHGLLGNSPLTYDQDGEELNADYPDIPDIVPSLAASKWAEKVGVREVLLKKKKRTLFHGPKFANTVTSSELLEHAQESVNLFDSIDPEFSEIAVILRPNSSGLDEYAEIPERKLVTSILRPDVMLDDEGHPTLEALEMHGLTASPSDISQKLIQTINLPTLIDIANKKPEAIRYIKAASIKGELDPHQAVEARLERNALLYAMLVTSEIYQKLLAYCQGD